MYKRCLLIFVAFAAVQAFGQGKMASRTPAQLFAEVDKYVVARYGDKGHQVTEEYLRQVGEEQKQMAVRYAKEITGRPSVAGEDLYYLGRIRWIAGDASGAVEALQKYVDAPGAMPDKQQAARSLMMSAHIKTKNLDAAERALNDYSSAQTSSQPGKKWKIITFGEVFNPDKALYAPRFRMRLDLARAYGEEKNYTKMAEHASKAFTTTQQMIKFDQMLPNKVENLRMSGLLMFEAYAGAGDTRRADAALDDLRAAAVSVQSAALYSSAINRKVRYLIETGRKAEYPQYLASVKSSVGSDLKSSAEVRSHIERDEQIYPLLGEKAPDLDAIDKWIQGGKNIGDLKGKVVVLDFWALWCGPCLKAMPSVNRLAEDFNELGLQVIGITRYYGKDMGMEQDKNQQVSAIRELKERQKLTYDIAVLGSAADQSLYGPTKLPTAIVIDKKGIIRDIQIGGSARDLESTIRSLLNQ